MLIAVCQLKKLSNNRIKLFQPLKNLKIMKIITFSKKIKSTITLFVFFIITSLVHSQNYKPFKVDVLLGYAIPKSEGNAVKAGVVFTLEPHYRLSDALAVGLRLEGAALAYSSLGSAGGKAEISVMTSYSLTGDYYFRDQGFRPFAGAGLGIFRSSALKLDEETAINGETTIPASSNFGFFPRIGFEAGHFRFSTEYNFIKDGGYLSFKIGLFIGGGKRKSEIQQ